MDLPWHHPDFVGWLIVGMNHYRIQGATRLYVAMVRGDRCIKAEGADTGELWDGLRHQALNS